VSHFTADEIAAAKRMAPMTSVVGRDGVKLKKKGRRYWGCCPIHAGDDRPSFVIYPDGHCHCYGCDFHADDQIDYLRQKGLSFGAAVERLRSLAGLPPEVVQDDDDETATTEVGAWTPIVPIPITATRLFDGTGRVSIFVPSQAGTARAYRRGTPVMSHPYRTPAGLAFYVVRFIGADGTKFTPAISYCRNPEGLARWCMTPPRPPRPLYHLDLIASRSDADILVVEGEKAADFAQRFLPSFVATTWCGGAKAHHLTDFAPLRHRHVVCWADADRQGAEAFDGWRDPRGRWHRGVIEVLHALCCGIRRVEIPPGVEPGWDCADATPQQARALIEAAEVMYG
jgi:hypothetical protein